MCKDDIRQALRSLALMNNNEALAMILVWYTYLSGAQMGKG